MIADIARGVLSVSCGATALRGEVDTSEMMRVFLRGTRETSEHWLLSEHNTLVSSWKPTISSWTTAQAKREQSIYTTR
jgi:hypothetical protein